MNSAAHLKLSVPTPRGLTGMVCYLVKCIFATPQRMEELLKDQKLVDGTVVDFEKKVTGTPRRNSLFNKSLFIFWNFLELGNFGT